MRNSSILLGIVLVFFLGLSGDSSRVGADRPGANVHNVRKAVNDQSNPKSVTSKPDDKKPSSSSPTKDVEKVTPKPAENGNTTTCVNGTNCPEEENGYLAHILDQVTKNKDMLLRTMYVLIGVTGIVIVYFVVRAWRLRSRRKKARKYGIITTPASDLEMAPLGQGDDDDEDEDMTVFEMNGKRMK